MQLTAVVISLKPREKVRLPISHGSYVHAAALKLFSETDSALGHLLHKSSRYKPITVSPLKGDWKKQAGELILMPESQYSWRITGLTKDTSASLLSLSINKSCIRLGPELSPALFTVTSLAKTRQHHRDAGQTSYEQLSQKWLNAGPIQEVTLYFITPTTFRAGQRERPWPLASLVFNSLLSKWNAFAPEQIKISPESLPDLDESVLLSNWTGETRRVEGPHKTTGFIGKFTYRIFDKNSELSRLIGLLSEYAFYAGVGWQTTHGLGHVRPQIHLAR